MSKNTEWKSRFQEVIQVCQDELKKTTKIGKKMLSASKTNSDLHSAYEQLGALVLKEIRNGNLEWNNNQAQELIEQIETCEADLEVIEEEVNKIRFAAGGPVDVSTLREEQVSNISKSSKEKSSRDH